MNGLLHGDPAVGQNLDGRLEVFAAGLDGTLLHNWQTEANGGWNV
jgi:hypothetical protein